MKPPANGHGVLSHNERIVTKTKLFGNKRGAAHVEGRSAAAKGAGRLTGTQKGILGIAASLLVLALAVVAVCKSFIKPPEIVQEPEPAPVISMEEEKPDAEPFKPPTVVQTETQVTEDGEEVVVETEVPASHKEGFYNVLIVGTDDDGTRTDTIMIARLDVITNEHLAEHCELPADKWEDELC